MARGTSEQSSMPDEIQEDDVCPKCRGKGRKMYPSGNTWYPGGGGQVLTMGLCNLCWGSGNHKRPFENQLELALELKALRKSNKGTDIW